MTSRQSPQWITPGVTRCDVVMDMLQLHSLALSAYIVTMHRTDLRYAVLLDCIVILTPCYISTVLVHKYRHATHPSPFCQPRCFPCTRCGTYRSSPAKLGNAYIAIPHHAAARCISQRCTTYAGYASNRATKSAPIRFCRTSSIEKVGHEMPCYPAPPVLQPAVSCTSNITGGPHTASTS